MAAALAYDHIVDARLYVIPGSHPSWTARLVLEHKGIDYKRVDLIPGPAKRTALKLKGFTGDTVPALMIDGRRVQGSREIVRELDRLQPEPALFPSDPELRSAVEQAESWGNSDFQSPVRRMIWNAFKRDSSPLESFAEGAKLGIPTGLAMKTAAPVIALAVRRNDATDENVARDLAALPGALQRIDDWIADGVLNGEELNAADFQIAPTLRLAMALDDVRPAIEGRPAGQLAVRVVPEFPGRAGPIFPAPWLEQFRAATPAAA
jgi:glutathione S-transferase